MNIHISSQHKASDIFQMVTGAAPDSTLCCDQERQFALIKIALIKSQRADLSIQLLNSRGGVLRQVTPRRKVDVDPAAEELSAGQVNAIKALEAAFRVCQAENLSLIGFSDGLVAIPRSLGVTLAALSSTAARDVDDSDVYTGFESDYDDD